MPEPISVNNSANIALDRAYTKTAGRMLLQITTITNSPRSDMQRSLRDLDLEAARLIENGERMKADNAELEKAIRTNEAALNTTQALILANDNAIQEAGQKLAIPALTAKVFLSITQAIVKSGIDPLSPAALNIYRGQIKRAGIVWNMPQVLDFASDYVNSPEWAAKMSVWGSGTAERTNATILKGIKSGWGPRTIASQMRKHAEGIPVHAAENLTRTLQLTSYRDASVAMEAVNGQYIVKKIRVAHLDNRTCLACIELHGTELAPGERVDDHYRGRCSEFYVVPGGQEQPSVMQADSEPGKRRFVPYQNGRDWFDSLPESRQSQQASFQKSPAKFRAFKAGTPLSEFVGEHQDPVFGRQVGEQSLKKAIGTEKAKELYTVNQND